MTPHNHAKPGDYAEAVLLPGDPLRAKWIAETFFDDAQAGQFGAQLPGLYRHLEGQAGFGAGHRHGPAVAGHLCA